MTAGQHFTSAVFVIMNTKTAGQRFTSAVSCNNEYNGVRTTFYKYSFL
jgi:hypothetical protein